MEKSLETFLKLCELFEQKNHQFYLVGGTVRDFLLRKPLLDMDAVTDATPEEMKEILVDVKSDFTFAKYGSIKVVMNDIKFDITTLRKEKKYVDSRHPGSIEFVKDLKQDFVRRDFTVNAMYLDKNFRLIDYCDGRNDLDKGVLKMVGDPSKRIKEDPLRIIRALRFSLTYNLAIDNSLKKAILKNKKLLEKLTLDKIKQDIKKIKNSDNEKIRSLFDEFDIKHYLNNVID